MVLTQISRLRFKQSKISMLTSHFYVSGFFVNFLVYLGINSFCQSVSEIYGNFDDLTVVLKLECEVKNL